MLNKDNIDQLLLKHLLQENAVEEEQLLKEWLGHDPEHQRYFERFRRHHIHLQAAIQSGRIQGQYIEFASLSETASYPPCLFYPELQPSP